MTVRPRALTTIATLVLAFGMAGCASRPTPATETTGKKESATSTSHHSQALFGTWKLVSLV